MVDAGTVGSLTCSVFEGVRTGTGFVGVGRGVSGNSFFTRYMVRLVRVEGVRCLVIGGRFAIVLRVKGEGLSF